jgi:hypothetical protein
MSNSKRVMKTLLKVSLYIVVIPAVAALLAYGEYWFTGQSGALTSDTLTLVLFLPLSFYYFPPTILFGEPLFIGGIGAGPTGLAGFLVGCLFYSLLSLFITVVYYAVKGTKVPNGD